MDSLLWHDPQLGPFVGWPLPQVLGHLAGKTKVYGRVDEPVPPLEAMPVYGRWSIQPFLIPQLLGMHFFLSLYT